MTKLEEWLKELGLQQYAGVLADNDVDFETLSELSENDLKELGLSLGHRRRLLKALAALQTAPTQPQPGSTKAESREAERRQVTVLFSDLVGSTALANEIDPEDMSALLTRYQDVCAGAISRFGGSIAKFLGDGVLAYFGYPQAHENAPERAVYAALAIIDGLAQIPGPTGGESIQSRIGIATGLVVIGDIIGSGMAREHSIVGETPNLAARLQAAAEPNTILVSQTTHRLLGRQFDYENLGHRTLKGFSNPVPVWRVVREASVSSRFAAGRSHESGRFVGRIEELDLLSDRWQSAKKGEGQIVFISGEPGMGKSRIVDAFSERISSDPYYLLICQCSPYHINSPLHPVIRQLERSAGFDGDDSSATKIEKLEGLLSATDNLNNSNRNLFADLLSVPLDDRYPPLESSPPQRKAATIAAIIHQLTRLAEQKPVLFVLEDAHWIDPTTQELVTRMIDGITTTRVLLAITARPEFLSPWTGDHVTALTLNGLDKSHCAELVADVAMEHALNQALIEDIVTKTDGVPLFIEELTKTVMESATSDRPAVPSTLRDSLMARLDRLGPAKEIAQVAAVIGQQFSYALLEKVSPSSSSEINSGVARLVAAGVAFPQGRATEPSYTFKHALMRDVAYDNLLKTRRQQLHGKVARELEENFQPTAESEPELVAYHFAQAGIAKSASNYYERAGDRATAHSNFAEAVAHFSASLQQAGQAGEDKDRSGRELDLLLKLGPAIAIIKGLQSPDAREVYERAQAIAKSLGDETGTFKATWGLWVSGNVGRNLAEARRLADELVEIAHQADDSDLLLEAFHCRWSTAQFRGDVLTSLADSKKGVELYDPARHSWMASVFGGHDPGVCAHAVQSNASTMLGKLNDAKKHVEEAISLAETLKHPHSVAHALQNATLAAQIIGDFEGVEYFAQRLLDLAQKYNFPPQGAHARLLSAWARAVGRDSKADLAVVEGEYPRAITIAPLFRYYAALLAEAQLKFGKVSEALTILESAIETVTEPGVGFCVSELYRLKGIGLLSQESPDKEQAVNLLRMAIDVAKQQDATVLELKAAISLAEAERSIGQAEKGMASLRDICASLPKEFDAPQLAKAKAMLSH